MELEVSEFLQNGRSWKEEARLFLHCVNIGEHFKIKDKKVWFKIQNLTAEEYPGEFHSRMEEDGSRRFFRVKNKVS